MTSDPESSFAKENCRTVFAVLDDQRLRAHGQHFLSGARQVFFIGQHFGFGVVDQQYVHQLQGFRQFLARALNPVIHGVASGEAHAVHLPPHVGLQGRLDVGQKQKLGVFVLLRNSRLKFLKHVQIGEVGLGFVEIFGVGAAPAKSFAGGALDAAGVDAALLQDVFMLAVKSSPTTATMRTWVK